MSVRVGAKCFWAVTGLVAYLDVFSTFWQYDDEGFMMLTVKHFLDGYPLYNEIWTPYGPFYYLYKWVVHGWSPSLSPTTGSDSCRSSCGWRPHQRAPW